MHFLSRTASQLLALFRFFPNSSFILHSSIISTLKPSPNLMKEAEEVLEILVFTWTMVQLISSQDFSAFVCRESFGCYLHISFLQFQDGDMTKFIMFFHEALESYLSAVQQITPIFAYMVSTSCFIHVCCVCDGERLLRRDSCAF